MRAQCPAIVLGIWREVNTPTAIDRFDCLRDQMDPSALDPNSILDGSRGSIVTGP